MPITKSAKKALRQSERRNALNIKRKKLLKKALKRFDGFVISQQTKDAREFLPHLYKIIDKAAKWGIVKTNTAARKKSRLTKILNKLK